MSHRTQIWAATLTIVLTNLWIGGFWQYFSSLALVFWVGLCDSWFGPFK